MTNYYLREEYQLALRDLESNCKPELFNYLLEILSEGHEKPLINPVLEENDNTSSFSSSSTTASERQLEWSDSKEDENFDKTDIMCRLSIRNDNKDIISRDSVQSKTKTKAIISKATTPTRCSSLPVCRKIMYKIPVSAHRTSSQSSSERGKKSVKKKMPSHNNMDEIHMRMGNIMLTGEHAAQSQYKTPYEPLIGKIDQSTPLLFDRGRKLPKPEKGVREFSNPISNPLYKVYNPKGYIKNQDEIAREFIMNITGKFNEWLRSFDGEPVQLCPEVIIKILREDLELPFKIPAQQKKKERAEESKPKLYTTRFQFEQPYIKLDLSI